MLHFIIGTRAQLIKTAPLMAECMKQGIDYNFIFMAQHKQTMVEMMDVFGIRKPDIILGDIGREISSVRLMVQWVLLVLFQGFFNLSRIFRGDRRGIAIVHGDALPVLLGAVLARAAGLRVAHVEAGLRSFSFAHPFPEELIRVLTWELRLVDYYFSPNQWALGNLAKYPGKKLDTRCNTLFDSLRMALEKKHELAERLHLPDGPFGIVSLHRFETISREEILRSVVEKLERIADGTRLLFVLHPPTLEALERYGLYDALARHESIELRPRSDYFSFIGLLVNSLFLITDGGSNQEECYYLGHPCLLLRRRTERTEGLESNVVLSDFDDRVIADFVANYQQYRSKADVEARPSEMIIQELARLSSRDA